MGMTAPIRLIRPDRQPLIASLNASCSGRLSPRPAKFPLTFVSILHDYRNKGKLSKSQLSPIKGSCKGPQPHRGPFTLDHKFP